VRSITFHPEAEEEFIAAGEFYERQTHGLGLDFITEVRRAARTIAAHPQIGHRFSKRLRRLLVRRFPYGLLYRLEPKGIFIVAVAHLHRRPNYWRGRP